MACFFAPPPSPKQPGGIYYKALDLPNDLNNLSLMAHEIPFNSQLSDSRLTRARQYNQHAPINKLPEELLILIFQLSENTKAECRMLDRVRLTWICSHWRAVALDAADLWRFIDLDCTHHSLVKEVIARSKLATLNVTQGHDDIPRFEDVNLQLDLLERHVHPHFARVENLTLRFSAPRWRDLRYILQTEAPSLKHLSFSKAKTEYHIVAPGRDFEMYEKDAILPSNLFNGMAQLETLTFWMPQEPPFVVLTPLMGNLRELILVTATADFASGRPMEQLLQALRVCSQLEILYIDTAQPEGSEVVIIPSLDGALQLPKLTRLVLQSTQDACILLHLVTPSLKQLYLTLDEDIPESLTGAIMRHVNMKAMQEVTLGNGGAFLASSGVHPASDWTRLDYKSADPEKYALAITCCQDLNTSILFPTLLCNADNLDRLILREGPFSDQTKCSWENMLEPVLGNAASIKHLVVSVRDDCRPILRLIEAKKFCSRMQTLTCIGGLHLENYVGSELVSFLEERKKDERIASTRRIRIAYCPEVDWYRAEDLNRLGVDLVQVNIKDEIPVNWSNLLQGKLLVTPL
ncbi:hypothetical protein M422DRAFT_29256 [Sphaerobolus stellatus SS14]|nr:hypothetical protein M422DRAFT_29256 [Sphaerobolus stellatus SS14]